MGTIRLFLMVLLCLLVNSIIVEARSTVRITGIVKDASSKEVLIGANIYNATTFMGVSSDEHGSFTVNVYTGDLYKISFIGYQTLDYVVKALQDTVIEFNLRQGKALSEVVVKASPRSQFNKNTLTTENLRNIISLGGKTDVLKVAQLMPGITSQNEASSVLLVRGGNPGENLYLLDNVALIYVNHIGGFLSVFNPDMINSMTIYKGGFPAKYGNKMSSIMEITQKEGDKKHYKGTFSFGLTDLSFSVEGPAFLKNSSFIITGRKTFYDAYMYLFTSLDAGNIASGLYGFHDINAKFSWQKNDKNHFSFNVFQGDDYLHYWTKNNAKADSKGHIGSTWGNWLTSLSWKHRASSSLFIKNNLSYTRYRLKDMQKIELKDANKTPPTSFLYKSTVQDFTLKSDWKYIVSSKYSLEFGLNQSVLFHLPNYTWTSQVGVLANQITNSTNSDLYIDHILLLSPSLDASLGARFGVYGNKGYISPFFEPRVNLNYHFGEKYTFNASFMRVTQHSHLLFTPGNIMSNEVWVPANKEIPSSYSYQTTLGVSSYLWEDRFLARANVYYKTLSNLATFKEGYSNLQGDVAWQSKIETGGVGVSKGLEFEFEKRSGRWTGFANYSYSLASRQFPNLNQGKEYRYEYDRPHCLTLNVNWEVNSKWSLNFTWVYQTGLPYTPIIGREYTMGLEPDENGVFPLYETVIYGEKNSDRMKDYHRLDIGAVYKKVNKRNNRVEWSFSIYNVYARQNPNYYYLNNTPNAEIFKPGYNEDFYGNQSLSLYQFSLFTFIPTFSYKVFFDSSIKKNKKKGLNK